MAKNNGYGKLKIMIKFSSRISLAVVLVLLIGVGIVGVYVHNHPKKTVQKAEYPEYLNFAGNYVFTVPQNYSVDEQSIPGTQLVYSGDLSAKTLEDVYNKSGISMAAISDLTDHSEKAFKNYVNNNFLPDLKKNTSTNDIKLKFDKTNGWDVARVTVKKDNQQYRFIYLKSGQHPVAIIAKQETDPFKKIEQTVTDVEVSDLKNETDSIKQSVKNNVQLAKDRKAHDLYDGATTELRSKNTEADVAKSLQTAATFTNQNITISGGSYKPGEFSALLRFTPLNKENPEPAFGSLILKKVDSQWKLEALTLPTPAAPTSQKP